VLFRSGVFIQAESEVAAINMCFGTAATGRRTMTSSSSPGISLKQEGISYCAGAELPVVIVNVMRGGPGLGNIEPSQGDYFQATKGGGHGDYRIIVLAPYSVEEFAQFVMLAFDLGDLYRTPVMVLADGQLGQMMEPCSFRAPPHRDARRGERCTIHSRLLFFEGSATSSARYCRRGGPSADCRCARSLS
jgi:2-oxoglutarate ferredoxin oxidoreductase subunit alpha